MSGRITDEQESERSEGPAPIQEHLREAAGILRRRADALDLLAESLPGKLPDGAEQIFRDIVWAYRAQNCV